MNSLKIKYKISLTHTRKQISSHYSAEKNAMRKKVLDLRKNVADGRCCQVGELPGTGGVSNKASKSDLAHGTALVRD